MKTPEFKIDYRRIPKNLRALFRAVINDSRFREDAERLLEFHKEVFPLTKHKNLSDTITGTFKNADKEVVFSVRTGRWSEAVNANNVLLEKLKGEGHKNLCSRGSTVTQPRSYKEQEK